MISIEQTLQQALLELSPQSDEARLESEILLSHVIQKNRAYIFAHKDHVLTAEQQEQYEQLITQRKQGIPIAYLTQSRAFWSLELKVTPDTLIPRHETELLVELALQLIPNEPGTKILDLGTGSGAIALAIAKERPLWHVDACDVIPEALALAQENAVSNQITNVHFYQSHWFQNIPKTRYHAILSNPPYIAPDDPHLGQGDVRFEPLSALVSKDQGLADLRHILQESIHYLLPQGFVLVEHGYDQKTQLRSIINQIGYKNASCWQDMLSHDRVSGGWLSDNSL